MVSTVAKRASCDSCQKDSNSLVFPKSLLQADPVYESEVIQTLVFALRLVLLRCERTSSNLKHRVAKLGGEQVVVKVVSMQCRVLGDFLLSMPIILRTFLDHTL